MKVNMKRRLVMVAGLVIIVIVATLAIVGGNAAAKPMTVVEARAIEGDVKIQVTGNVVKNSFSIENNVLHFKIYDPETDPMAQAQLGVRYDGSISDTFGNDVIAICTGKKDDGGVLVCSELVTKCPSKYENASDAISVEQLLRYGDTVIDSPVKVSGILEEDSLSVVPQEARFAVLGEGGNERLAVVYDGALPDSIEDGARVLLTGSLDSDGRFRASNVVLEG